MPDGTPAHGVAVRASAIGERDDGQTEAVHSRTDDAGRFAPQLFPNVTYVLSASAVDLSSTARIVTDADRSVILKLAR
jgi:hypothetical protein